MSNSITSLLGGLFNSTEASNSGLSSLLGLTNLANGDSNKDNSFESAMTYEPGKALQNTIDNPTTTDSSGSSLNVNQLLQGLGSLSSSLKSDNTSTQQQMVPSMDSGSGQVYRASTLSPYAQAMQKLNTTVLGSNSNPFMGGK